jgi:hypothetical protein
MRGLKVPSREVATPWNMRDEGMRLIHSTRNQRIRPWAAYIMNCTETLCLLDICQALLGTAQSSADEQR